MEVGEMEVGQMGVGKQVPVPMTCAVHTQYCKMCHTYVAL